MWLHFYAEKNPNEQKCKTLVLFKSLKNPFCPNIKNVDLNSLTGWNTFLLWTNTQTISWKGICAVILVHTWVWLMWFGSSSPQLGKNNNNIVAI